MTMHYGLEADLRSIIRSAHGDLNKAIRAFNRACSDLDADDKQNAADEFNVLWTKLHPERPLKIARGALVRFIRSGRCKPPAGYRKEAA